MKQTPPRGKALRVPFGLRYGQLFEPLQVESGLDCGCVCPSCGDRLIAKHAPSGAIAPHFAHHAGSDCASGFETAVHLAAKQLIDERRQIFLPAVRANVSKMSPDGWIAYRTSTLQKEGLVLLKDVAIEERLGKIRPDVIVEVGSSRVVVEIAVTHFVDDEKLVQLKHLGFPTLEIDLSQLRQMSFVALEGALFTSAQQSKWVWHPDVLAEELRLKAALDASLAEMVRMRETAESQPDFDWRGKRHPHSSFAAKDRGLHHQRVTKLSMKAQAFRALPAAEKLRKALHWMNVADDQFDSLLTVQTRAQRAIAVQPQVWQAAAFAGLVHGALKRGNMELTSAEVRTWLKDRFEIAGDEQALGVAVWDYLDGMSKHNVLHHLGRQRFLVAVPGLAGALAVSKDLKTRERCPLIWEEFWPSREQTTTVGEVFTRIYGQIVDWNRVSGLLFQASAQEAPEGTIQYYARKGMNATALRRYFLSAGFARLA